MCVQTSNIIAYSFRAGGALHPLRSSVRRFSQLLLLFLLLLFRHFRLTRVRRNVIRRRALAESVAATRSSRIRFRRDTGGGGYCVDAAEFPARLELPLRPLRRRVRRCQEFQRTRLDRQIRGRDFRALGIFDLGVQVHRPLPDEFRILFLRRLLPVHTHGYLHLGRGLRDTLSLPPRLLPRLPRVVFVLVVDEQLYFLELRLSKKIIEEFKRIFIYFLFFYVIIMYINNLVI